MSDDSLPERANKVTVIKILDYLLDNDLMKIGSIEGADKYFPELEKIIEDSRQGQKRKFREWAEYWGKLQHKLNCPGNSTIDLKDCSYGICSSLAKSVKELE